MNPDPSASTGLLTLPRAARRFGVSQKALRRAVKDGELAAYQIGDRWYRVRPEAVEAWIRSKRVPTPSALVEARVLRVLERERTTGRRK